MSTPDTGASDGAVVDPGPHCDGPCPQCIGVTPAPGQACGECGHYVCNADDKSTSCDDPGKNKCGGCSTLTAEPGAACGQCGKQVCSADKNSVTCDDPKYNACGGCGVLASAPGSSCGGCGDWACTTDKTAVKCNGTNTNACGGCGTLAQAPGGACGTCGKYTCSADKSATTCVDPGANACGGCAVLTGKKGDACGTCGHLQCATDNNSLVCGGDSPNACKGCAALTPSGGAPGASCGTCGRTYVCNADKNSLSCQGTAPNVCGGCTAITGTLGASCGNCSTNGCSADKNALVCNYLCTTGQLCFQGSCRTPSCTGVPCGGSDGAGGTCGCATGTCIGGVCKTPNCTGANSCGQSDGANGTCTGTAGKCSTPNTHCTTTCICNKATLSCSGSGSICGSWDFESNDPGREGWSHSSYGKDAYGGTMGITTQDHFGTGASSLGVAYDGNVGSTLVVEAPLCPAGSGSLSGKHIKARVKPSSPGPALGASGSGTVKVLATDGSGPVFFGDTDMDVNNGWTAIDVPIAESGFAVNNIVGIGIEIFFTTSSAWKGTIYIDQVSIE